MFRAHQKGKAWTLMNWFGRCFYSLKYMNLNNYWPPVFLSYSNDSFATSFQMSAAFSFEPQWILVIIKSKIPRFLQCLKSDLFGFVSLLYQWVGLEGKRKIILKKNLHSEDRPSRPNGLHHLSPVFRDSSKIQPLMNNLTHRHKGALEGGGSDRLFRKTQGGLKIVWGRIRREKKGRQEGEREKEAGWREERKREEGGHEGMKDKEKVRKSFDVFPSAERGIRLGCWIQSLKGLTGLLNAPAAPMPSSMMGLMPA